MIAMILAAGRGERMRPLTDRTPKPLLEIGGISLIEHQLLKLKRAGIDDVVVNVAHLRDQLQTFLGTGERWGLSIRLSDEPDDALETGGGIRQALEWLGPAPFILMNGDVWCDLDLRTLPWSPDGLAHLVLVPNPGHHPDGDFALRGSRVVMEGTRHTYAGIAVIDPTLVANCAPGRFPLAPLLAKAIKSDQVSGQLHRGQWIDVGTSERLREADALLRAQNSP
jgi:MurNAc alpha-1-phosphate uridylyltransferase